MPVCVLGVVGLGVGLACGIGYAFKKTNTKVKPPRH